MSPSRSLPISLALLLAGITFATGGLREPIDRNAASASAPDPDSDPAAVEFFERKIRPLLVENCFRCHSTEANKSKGGLVFDGRAALLKGGDSGPAIVPGSPDQSRLIEAVR